MTGRVGAHVLSPGAPGAPLVVFAHGLEDSWTSWRALAAELDPTWRALALDLPWRAGNDYRWRSRRPVAWLREALAGLGAVPDVLVAHSFGGTAALALACAGDPLAGRALALVCPVYRSPDTPVTWQTFDDARRSFDRTIRDGVRAQLGSRTGTLEPDLLRTMTDLAVDRIGPTAFLAVFDEFVRSAELAVPRVRVPAVVVAAPRDATLSRRAAAALGAALPLGRVESDPALDHHCHVRRPRGVAAPVAALMATTARSTGEAA